MQKFKKYFFIFLNDQLKMSNVCLIFFRLYRAGRLIPKFVNFPNCDNILSYHVNAKIEGIFFNLPK